MKKSIISFMLVVAMLSTSVGVFANDVECSPEDECCNIQVTEETKEVIETIATEENTEVECSDGIECEETVNVDGVLETEEQVTVLPIIMNGNGPARELQDDNMVLMTEGVNPLITDAGTDDFFADEEIFSVRIQADNAKDLRKNLKITIVDEDDTTIATQQDVFYEDVYNDGSVSFIYTMKRVKNVSNEKTYSMKFSYSGSYELEFDIYSTEVYPITDVAIKALEVIDYAENSYRVILANATAGDTYKLYYRTSWDPYEQLIEKTATVQSDSSLIVSFGGVFSSNGDIYLCELDATSYWDSLDQIDLWDFEYDMYETDSYNGVGCDDYISSSADSVWIYLWEKGFGYQSYETSDLNKLSAYMMDVTTGEKVGQLDDKEYYEYGDGYCQLDGNIKLTKKLDESHKYIIVCDDGYTLRIHDDFVVTSDKKITNSYYYVNLTDETNTQPENMPSGIKTFYAYISSININDRNNIKVELLDSTGKVVANGTYDKNNRYLMTASSAISAGEYTLKVTYADLVYTDKLKFLEGMDNSAYQYVQSAIVYDGKAYLVARLESKTLNPETMNFKVEIDDGSVFDAEFHRSLYSNNNNHYFVVTIDDELTDVDYSNRGFLKMYSGSTYITPEYVDNMDFTVGKRTDSPFMYDQIKISNTGAEIFVEGVNSESGTYTLCAIDDETETSKTVNLTKRTGEQTLVASKTELNKITVKYPIMTGYGVTNKEYYVEKNGELFGSFYSSEIGNGVLDSTYGFIKAFTNRQYEVLNLPYTKYASYRIATSQSELSSKSYQAIDVGLLYKLSSANGTQKVYAQFKTSDGKESAVMNTTITLDTVAPTFEVTTDVKTSYVIDEYEEFEIEVGINAAEAGNIHFNFFDKNNNEIGYDRTRSVAAGLDSITATFWADDYDYEAATKMVLYMTDKAGNKSSEYSFNISIVRQYSIYETDTTYIKLNNETGIIEEFDSTEEVIVVPSEIKGVKVIGIDDYAFIDNDMAVSIKIPDTVTSISEYAFDDLYEYTLLVKENSAAHRFAIANDVPFELVTYKIGDIFEDDAVNSKDAIKLSQYLAKWSVSLTDDQKSAADIFVDGNINSKDSIKLSQYLAKWNVTLE